MSGRRVLQDDEGWMLPGGGEAQPRRTALVLAGGKSLGAFEAGAYQALHAAGLRPDWVVGASIGAVNGAIIAGNPADRRVEALRRFWSKAAQPSLPWDFGLGVWGDAMRRWAAEAQAMMFGSPAVFTPNPMLPAAYAWPAPAASIGLYQLAPLRRTLEEVVDFDLLNRGEVRLTVVAVDLETGEEAHFDTRRGRIGPQHILASGAMLGDFPPVEIDGRFYVDGGLRSNLPVDVVRHDAQHATLCLAIDLFSAQGHRYRNMAEATIRREELLLVSPGLRALGAHEREAALRRALRTVLGLLPEKLRDRQDVQVASAEAARPDITFIRLALPSGEETGVNTYDWSNRTLSQRWDLGKQAAADAVRVLSPGMRPAVAS